MTPAPFPRFWLSVFRRSLMIFFTAVVFVLVLWTRVRYRDPDKRVRAAKDHCARGLRWGARVLRYRIRTHGSLPEGGALLAPNHTGYGEVLALGGQSRCLFVPKQEIGDWPVVGAIARMTGHVLVDRKAGRAMKSTAAKIRERLEAGYHVCVFLEGTTTSGEHLLPFRASFLQPAIDAGVPVVPVGLRWSVAQAGASVRDDIAFWKPTGPNFWKHLARHAGWRGFELDIFYGEPVDSRAWDRKALARELEQRVAAMLDLEVLERRPE